MLDGYRVFFLVFLQLLSVQSIAREITYPSSNGGSHWGERGTDGTSEAGVSGWDTIYDFEGGTLYHWNIKITPRQHQAQDRRHSTPEQETGDRRQETGDRRQETGDKRQETRDKRQETRDKRQET